MSNINMELVMLVMRKGCGYNWLGMLASDGF